MRNTLAKALFIAFLTPTAWAQGFIENPPNLGTESGIGVISGFHCSSRDISFRINGNSIGKAGAGTDRGDTQQLCGRADTGFSLLFNFNLLTPGTHSLSMYADGQLVETRSFKSTRSAGEVYAQGKNKKILVSDFPKTGEKAILEWVTSKQAFVITDAGPYAAANHACDSTSSLHGIWDIDGTRFSLHRDNMLRMDDPKSPAPCTIPAAESNSFDSYAASYSPELQEYMFLKFGSVTGVAYFMTPVADKPNELKGYKTNFWVRDFSMYGGTTPVTARRTSTNVRATLHDSPNTSNTLLRATEALGSLGR
jgi:hypothetical protein